MGVILTDLFKIQRGLDEFIAKEKGIDNKDRDIIKKRMFAGIIETGECANDHQQCFKFWKVHNEPKETLLKEYVDVLHFILSSGNALMDLKEVENDLTAFEYEAMVNDGNNIMEQFIDVYGWQMNLYLSFEGYLPDIEESFKLLMEMFLGLGVLLGFTPEQIKAEYLTKNEENYKRQQNNY